MTAVRATTTMLLLLAASLSAHAQVYRSVDEQGNVIFSDSPPEDAVEVAPIEIRPGPSDDQVRQTQERLDAQHEVLAEQEAARAAEEARRREERMRQREAQAQRQAAQSGQTQASDPDARAWWYRGHRPPPRPSPPIARPPPSRPRPPGGDHPAFRPQF